MPRAGCRTDGGMENASRDSPATGGVIFQPFLPSAKFSTGSRGHLASQVFVLLQMIQHVEVSAIVNIPHVEAMLANPSLH